MCSNGKGILYIAPFTNDLFDRTFSHMFDGCGDLDSISVSGAFTQLDLTTRMAHTLLEPPRLLFVWTMMKCFFLHNTTASHSLQNHLSFPRFNQTFAHATKPETKFPCHSYVHPPQQRSPRHVNPRNHIIATMDCITTRTSSRKPKPRLHRSGCQ